MKERNMRQLMACGLVVSVLLLLSGCATTSDPIGQRNITLERVASQRASVSHAYLIDNAGQVAVRGELTKSRLMRGRIPGHLHVTVVDATGTVLSDTAIRYKRKSAKSHKSTFSLVLPVDPPSGSTVRVTHHASNHAHPSAS